jgi:TrmH family RNA methyltransferase
MQALLARQRGLLLHRHQQQSRCGPPGRRAAATAAAASAADTTPAAPPTPRHGELITSPSNRYVRHCVRLRDSPRHRWEHGSVLLVGATLLTELAARHEAGSARGGGGGGGGGSSCSSKGLANARVLFVPAEEEEEEEDGNAGADSSRSGLAALVQQHQQQQQQQQRQRQQKQQTSGDDGKNNTRRPAAVVRASLAVLRALAGVPTAGEGADGEDRLAAAVVDIPRDLVAYVKADGNAATAAAAAAEQASRVLLDPPSPRPLRLLALDGVQDPGNLGTLLRTAAAFGWRGAWLLPGCADPYGAKAVRAARGLQLRWPLVTGPGAGWDALEALADAHGARLVAAALPGQVGGGEGEEEDKARRGGRKRRTRPDDGGGGDGESGDADAADDGRDGNIILVLGAEGQGLSAEALRRCDASLSVPMVDGAMESLNVAVAGGVLMFALGAGGGGGGEQQGGKRRGGESAAAASNPAVKTLLRDVDALF